MNKESTRATTAPDLCQFCEKSVANCKCFAHRREMPSPSTGGEPDYAAEEFLRAARVALVSLAHAAEKHGIYQTDYERFAAAIEKFAASKVAGGEPATDSTALFAAFVSTLPKPVQDNIEASHARGESFTAKAFCAGLAAREPAPVARELAQFVIDNSMSCGGCTNGVTCNGCGVEFTGDEGEQEHNPGCIVARAESIVATAESAPASAAPDEQQEPKHG